MVFCDDNYFCNLRNRRGVAFCDMPFTPVETMDNAVIEILKQIKLDKSMIDNFRNDYEHTHSIYTPLISYADPEYFGEKYAKEYFNSFKTLFGFQYGSYSK